MAVKYNEFAARIAGTQRLFHSFQNKYTKIRSDLRQRELLSNTGSRYAAAWHRETETELNWMEVRVNALKTVRRGHSEIRRVIDSTFAASDQQTLSNQRMKINAAYAVFKKIDVLRCTEVEWQQCFDQYSSMIKDVESEIQGFIRVEMERAQNPREMFRVCEKYNKLFVRDRIRQAVWEFQSTLVSNVQEEVRSLQQRYRRRYKNIPASKLSLLRDIPPVSGLFAF